MEVTLGGNRVGSGKKMKAHLHNYNRSTHNLSERWASSAASGVLYPALCKLAMRGDTFDIRINADARTIPTKGPLFGSYKMQVDVYQCPVRLYQGLLHNNPQAIGLNMAQIKFPVIQVMTKHWQTSKNDEGEFNKSCLLKYLGMSGLGTPKIAQTTAEFGRKINALPLLSYYDIFKTYYANKQEEVGYVITGDEGETRVPQIGSWSIGNSNWLAPLTNMPISSEGEGTFISIRYNKVLTESYILENTDVVITTTYGTSTMTLDDIKNGFGGIFLYTEKNTEINGGHSTMFVLLDTNTIQQMLDDTTQEEEHPTDGLIHLAEWNEEEYTRKKLVLKEFPLENIDEMRYELLSMHTLGTAFTIGYGGDWHDGKGTSEDGMPYAANFMQTQHGAQAAIREHLSYNNCFPMNGLLLKTYQNDIFNNWLNTEWIEGENGINEMTKVEVDENGAFSMDSLNFAQKLYNMLNRIAVAGNTYEDWQDVVYEEVQQRQIESPMYCGGFATELMFDEIIQTAPADGDPLGTLGGRGRIVGKPKGGNIHIKCNEACFIIAIVSLTPRIYYTQGNEFYMTDIFSMDDLHKPAMDGIGFQDLIGERLGWWNTVVDNGTEVYHRSRIGKLPAWIEYMTSVDKAYGDFAENFGKGYMILNRNYEPELTETESGGVPAGALTSQIKDATTYVDPSKYNYVFAYTELEAQNFWLQVNFDIKARRLMSARLIPNV